MIEGKDAQDLCQECKVRHCSLFKFEMYFESETSVITSGFSAGLASLTRGTSWRGVGYEAQDGGGGGARRSL